MTAPSDGWQDSKTISSVAIFAHVFGAHFIMKQSFLPWSRRQRITSVSSADLMHESQLPLAMAHYIEYADYASLVKIAVSSTAALQGIKSFSTTRELRIDFSRHRGYCSFPKTACGLHYCDSLLSSLEPPAAFRDAMKYALTRPEGKSSAKWHVEELQARNTATWQKRLFAAMLPTIARALPLAWRPCMLRKLWVLGHGSKLNKLSLAAEADAQIDAKPNADAWARRQESAVARKVISDTMSWDEAWKVSEAFQHWAGLA